jgi:hypothetical protein
MNKNSNIKNLSALKFKYAFLFAFVTLTISSPPEDLITDGIPGYPSTFNQRVFSGYLSTSSDLRKIHYIFIENYKG